MSARPLAAVWAVAMLLGSCALAAAAPTAARAQAATSTFRSGALMATVTHAPFDLVVTDGDRVVVDTAARDATDPSGRTGPLGFGVAASAEAHQLGYSLTEQVPVRWFHATAVTDVSPDGVLTLATDDPAGRSIELRVVPRGDGVLEFAASLSDTRAVTVTGATYDRIDDERYLGLGERSDGADQTGNEVVNWNEEGPFSAGYLQPYTDPVFGPRWQGPQPLPGTNFAMPWVVSSRGWGYLLDSTWLNGFDLAATDDERWSVQTREPAFRFRVYGGPTPAAVVQRFTDDTGRQPEPAEWFFGPWDQLGVDPEYWREHDVPVTVAQTYTHYLPCAAQVGNRDAQKERVARHHALGYAITTYVNSFVCVDHPEGAHAEGDANGWFIRHAATGTSYPVPYVAYLDRPYHGVVDFTDPGAVAYWHGLIGEALEDGYDGWMEDFGEYVPVDSVTADGRPGLAHHNEYCTLYHRASHELTWPTKGRDFAQFVRCGYTGTAPYARIVWGADPSEDWSEADGLKATVHQGISMGLSGIGYWGSDIGGFHAIQHRDRTDAELQSRWLQVGALSGIMRTQRNGYPRPGPTYFEERAQLYDEDVQPIWRRYTKLRTQLFPEIWRAAMAYQDSGMPLMRHVGLMFADDPAVWDPANRFDYLFGDDILVAPVVEEGATQRTVHLPAGAGWVDFWQAVAYDESTGSFERVGTAEVLTGGQDVTVKAPLEILPMFVRAGSCLTLLPAETDTLAEFGDAPGLVHRSDVAGRERTLGFGVDCSGAAGGADPAGDPSSLPATGGGLAGLAMFVAVAAARRRRAT